MIAAHTLTRRVRTLTFTILISCPGGLALAQQPATPQALPASAQSPPADVDTRAQYPAFLANAYFGVQVAYIDYNFTDRQLEPGFRVGSITIPHAAARIDLLGYRFNRFVSVHGTYLRPVAYVTYHDINGDARPHHVWMNFGAVMLQGQAPVAGRLSIYAEAGLGVVSRRGFDDDGTPVVLHAHYPSAVAGAGLIYHASPTWDLLAGVTYFPQRASERQPDTELVTAGFRYNMRALSDERVEASRRAGFIFPENIVQFEYSTGRGYDVNTFLSSTVPIFWGGNVQIGRGAAVHYTRNVFHTRKIFALDLGASASYWKSRGQQDKFVTLSVYPLLRFTFLRTKPADVYFMYSFAGPTYISKVVIDGLGTGSHFTFQDFLGAGVFLGSKRNLSLAVKINHYSNGNIFIDNASLKIPLTISVGYAF